MDSILTAAPHRLQKVDDPEMVKGPPPAEDGAVLVACDQVDKAVKPGYALCGCSRFRVGRWLVSRIDLSYGPEISSVCFCHAHQVLLNELGLIPAKLVQGTDQRRKESEAEDETDRPREIEARLRFVVFWVGLGIRVSVRASKKGSKGHDLRLWGRHTPCSHCQMLLKMGS